MNQPSPPRSTTAPPAAPRPAPPGVAAPAAPLEVGRALSVRVLIVGLLLIPLNCYWIIQMERVRQGPYVTSISLFANVVFILLLFVAVNSLLHRWCPRLALRRGGVLLVFVIVSISSGLCGWGMVLGVMRIIC